MSSPSNSRSIGLGGLKKKGLNISVSNEDYEEEKRPHTTTNPKRTDAKSMTFTGGVSTN